MTPPSPRAKKRADMLVKGCGHTPSAFENGRRVGDPGACAACIARALDAEREACACIADEADHGELTGDNIARAIRALAEEEV